MICGVIEFRIKPGKEDRYQDFAMPLHEKVQTMDGFISVERFESKTEPGKLLSLSFWRDAEALAAWYREAEHRAAMAAGKNEIFADYRITVAEVTRQYDFKAD